MQRVKGKSEFARTPNDQLDNIYNHIRCDYTSLSGQDEAVSANILVDMLTGKNKKRHSLISVFELNNKLNEAEEGQKYSRSTIDQYNTTLERIRIFLKQEYECNDFDLSKLDALFIKK